MLDELHVHNLALIREATLSPAPGFTVLTGETGAGKTALLSACRLLVGERATRESVREGARELEISGRFFLTSGESANADDNAEQELVVTRRVGADGRSRAAINGTMASVSELAQRCGPLIDLCSQHEHQQLLKPAHHRALLDQWATEEIAPLKSAYGQAFARAEAAKKTLEALEDAARRSEAELDAARFTLKTIDEVSPLEGEYEELRQTLDRAEHGEALARAATEAHGALANEGGALESLTTAEQALLGATALDGALAPLAERTRSALIDLEDLAGELRVYRDAVDFDPETLAEASERLAALRGLLRSYGPRIEDVLAARDQAAEIVSASVDGTERRAQVLAELDDAEAALAEAARALSEARSLAAPRFSEAVTRQMDRLEMGGATLICELRDLEREHWTKHGAQSVEFLFRPGARLSARPLARIASGGELSRVMLAIKVVLGDRDDVETLIFDEIDAGVGGAVATALAEVLVDLARTHQVIAVTHLAQLAACADAHYLVRRSAKDVPQTEIEPLDEGARVREIARMLSGDATEISLAHAEELLATSRR